MRDVNTFQLTKIFLVSVIGLDHPWGYQKCNNEDDKKTLLCCEID